MSKKLVNQVYHKEIESEICLDQGMIDKMNLPNNQNINFSFSNNNVNNSVNDNDNQNSIFQTNILLNSLQEFFKYYDEKKIFVKKRFIISFNELFLLLNDSILSQEKIDSIMYNYKDNNIIKIKEINQKYLNDLSYKIFSFNTMNYESGNDNENVYDNDNNNDMFNIKPKKIIKSNISPYNFKFQNTSKIKASFNNSQVYILPNHFKNEINTIFDNIYNKIFIKNNNSSHHLKKSKKKNSKINKKKDLSQSSKTKIKNKNKINNDNRNRSAIINRKNKSSLNTSKSSVNLKKNRIYNNSSNNSSILSNNSINYLTNKSTNNKSISNNKKSFNKKKFSKKKESLKKSNTYRSIKTSKNNDKDLLKSSDIFLACESINEIKKTGNKKLFSKKNKMRQIDSIDNNSFIKKKHKSVGLKKVYNSSEVPDLVGCNNLKLNNGIKKIIISYTHKPSDFVNKLVITGQKCVDDFEELNEDYTKLKKSKKI